MTITKEQLKDLGWALMMARRCVGDVSGDRNTIYLRRLVSAEAGLKALMAKPVCSTCGTADVEHLSLCHNSECKACAAYETTYQGWAGQAERAAPTPDFEDDSGQPISFEEEIKSKDW